MDGGTRLINSTEDLVRVTRDENVRLIVVTVDLDDVPAIRLASGFVRFQTVR